MTGPADNDNQARRGSAKMPGKESLIRPLPRRFYRTASAGAHAQGFVVLLDGHPARTPKKRHLVLPTAALADAVAAEWSEQGERINHNAMPLTKFANTAIDAVRGTEAEVAGDIVKYARSDLVCYRAEGPQALVELQSRSWEPVLTWATERFGTSFTVGKGVMPVVQSASTLDRIGVALAPFDAFALTGLHVMTTLSGSALLALAAVHGRLTPQEAWAAAHVDEDWQISQWGPDAEAEERRRRRRREFEAASRLLTLLGTIGPDAGV